MMFGMLNFKGVTGLYPIMQLTAIIGNNLKWENGVLIVRW